jgi:hypothetical protein
MSSKAIDMLRQAEEKELSAKLKKHTADNITRAEDAEYDIYNITRVFLNDPQFRNDSQERTRVLTYCRELLKFIPEPQKTSVRNDIIKDFKKPPDNIIEYNRKKKIQKIQQEQQASKKLYDAGICKYCGEYDYKAFFSRQFLLFNLR